MIEVRKFVCNMLQENTYVVNDETRQAVVIDCGALYDEERQAVVDYIDNQQLKPVHLLCTHGHFDHIFGNDTIWRVYGLLPEVAAEDEMLMDLRTQVEQMIGTGYQRDVPPIGRLLGADDVISFGSHQLTVLPTPGHTRGSVSFYCKTENIIFTGDTLFRMSIGRTDFPGGSWSQMNDSLKRLSTLPADTKVYTGHGEPTTIGEEKQYNPYMNT